ncbi:MAG: hypothetical protein HYX93_05310 [Chloroflexi bacterium]|nr:hypothetical protein [Chloroflexota bacterium]
MIERLAGEDIRKLAREEAKEVCRTLVLARPSFETTTKVRVPAEEVPLGLRILTNDFEAHYLTYPTGPYRESTYRPRDVMIAHRIFLREDMEKENILRAKVIEQIDQATITGHESA